MPERTIGLSFGKPEAEWLQDLNSRLTISNHKVFNLLTNCTGTVQLMIAESSSLLRIYTIVYKPATPVIAVAHDGLLLSAKHYYINTFVPLIIFAGALSNRM